MKAWRGETDGSPGPPDERALDDLRRRGIDLDPTGHDRRAGASGARDEHGSDSGHGADHDHAGQPPDEIHAHPHRRGGPDEPPVVGIVGAGAVGAALGLALHRAGWTVGAVASRDAGRRERFRSLVPGARAFVEPHALLDEVELIVLAVPDDAIASLAGELRMYSGQAMIHTSGALGAEVLEPALAAGTQIGSFHPLVAFADTERAVAAFHGATVAVEGDRELVALLARLAEAIGATAVQLAPGSKAAYHAAAVLAAGGFVALLDAIAELGAAAGLDEAGSIAIYGNLVEQSLGNARALGTRAALTGPMVRGDAGTLERHVVAVTRLAPSVLPIYSALAEREIALAEARGAIDREAAEVLRRVLAMRV
jgi:predicted short-subunit dehydrogenase-like oxidoreductase (DUF2520 family)